MSDWKVVSKNVDQLVELYKFGIDNFLIGRCLTFCPPDNMSRQVSVWQSRDRRQSTQLGLKPKKGNFQAEKVYCIAARVLWTILQEWGGGGSAMHYSFKLGIFERKVQTLSSQRLFCSARRTLPGRSCSAGICRHGKLPGNIFGNVLCRERCSSWRQSPIIEM